MNKLLHIIFLSVVAAVIFTPLAKKADAPEKSADFLKARYYFLQGTAAEAAGEPAEAYEFYKKAWQADPAYPEAGYSYGMMRFTLDNDTLGTLEEKRRSLAFARPLIDKYPGDYYTAMNYAYMAGMVDTVAEPIAVFERLVELCPDKTTSLLYLAQFYTMQKETAKAIDAFNRYERIEGPSVPLTLRKVVTLLADSDTTAAIAEAQRLIDSNPSDPNNIMLMGNVLEYLSMPDSALAFYRRAEEAAPESGAVKQQLAKFYASQGDSVNYDLMTYQSLLCEDLDANEKTEQMAAYLQQIINDKADTQRGDTLFNVLRNQYPHDPEILYLSARYNAAKKNYDTAIEDVRYAIDLNGEKEDLWQSLMLFQLSDDRPADAMKTYREMQKKIPESTFATDMLFANAAVQSDSIPTATAIYQDYLSKIDKSLTLADTIKDKSRYRNLTIDETGTISELYEMAGDAFYAANPKQMEDALRSYENSLFFNPDNYLALNNYAYFIVDVENPDPESPRFQRAREMSRRTVENSGQPNGTYYDTYAWILFKEGNYKEARQYQKAAIEIEENAGTATSELYSHYGDILFMSGDPDQALEYWEKALKMEPSDELLRKKVKNKTFYWK